MTKSGAKMAAVLTLLCVAAAAPAAAQDPLPSASEARERAREILSESRSGEHAGVGSGGGGQTGGRGEASGSTGTAPDEPDPSSGEGLDLPGISASPSVGWLIYAALAAGIIALVVWFGRRAVDQEVAEAIERKRKASPGRVHVDELDRAAERAEAEGAMALALRVRFRACLLRLGEAGAIKLSPSLTARGAGRQVGSPDFDEIVRSFEAVAYGGREPSEGESRAARERWPVVIRRLGA